MPPRLVAPVEVIAVGEAPDWRLTRQGDVVVLHRTALPDVTAIPVAESDTPQGRVVQAAIVGGGGAMMTWRYTPGVCRVAATGDTAGFISVMLPDSVILHGCVRPR